MAYTEDQKEIIFNTICNRMEKGESLRTILLEKDMPSSSTFYIWLDNDENKSKRYARATELRADYIFDQMFDIADDGTNDFTTKIQQGEEIKVLDSEHIQRSRLRIDTRKWALSKLNPKKYGDKIHTEHSGEIKTNNKVDLSKLSEQELRAYAELQSKLERD